MSKKSIIHHDAHYHLLHAIIVLSFTDITEEKGWVANKVKPHFEKLILALIELALKLPICTFPFLEGNREMPNAEIKETENVMYQH